jgi:uncharacterized repeat protein (TIGR03803 family)
VPPKVVVPEVTRTAAAIFRDVEPYSTLLHPAKKQFFTASKVAMMAVPSSGLNEVSGSLYGTTGIGGAYDDGTVFALKLR